MRKSASGGARRAFTMRASTGRACLACRVCLAGLTGLKPDVPDKPDVSDGSDRPTEPNDAGGGRHTGGHGKE